MYAAAVEADIRTASRLHARRPCILHVAMKKRRTRLAAHEYTMAARLSYVAALELTVCRSAYKDATRRLAFEAALREARTTAAHNHSVSEGALAAIWL